MFDTTRCCFCCDLKTGIIVLGCWETFWLMLTIIGLIFSVFGMSESYDYNIVPVYVNPFLVELPRVAVFFYLVIKSYEKKARYVYYRVRFVCLIFHFLCWLVHIIMAWIMITGNYKLTYCNGRTVSGYTREDYEKQCDGSVCNLLYDDYEDWVHSGRSATQCAVEKTVWITVVEFLYMLLQTHFLAVAYSFWKDNQERRVRHVENDSSSEVADRRPSRRDSRFQGQSVQISSNTQAVQGVPYTDHSNQPIGHMQHQQPVMMSVPQGDMYHQQQFQQQHMQPVLQQPIPVLQSETKQLFNIDGSTRYQ